MPDDARRCPTSPTEHRRRCTTEHDGARRSTTEHDGARATMRDDARRSTTEHRRRCAGDVARAGGGPALRPCNLAQSGVRRAGRRSDRARSLFSLALCRRYPSRLTRSPRPPAPGHHHLRRGDETVAYAESRTAADPPGAPSPHELNMSHETCSSLHELNMRHATCDMRHATCDMRHATCDMRHATCDMRHATCDMRHATCAMFIATRNQPVPCDMFIVARTQHVTWDMFIASRHTQKHRPRGEAPWSLQGSPPPPVVYAASAGPSEHPDTWRFEHVVRDIPARRRCAPRGGVGPALGRADRIVLQHRWWCPGAGGRVDRV
jgi:hypothetical protein